MVPYRNKISWSGVFAGLIVGIVVFLASLNVGALLVSLLRLDFTGTGWLSLIWTILSVIAAAFVAGAVSMYTQTPDAKVYELESTPEEIDHVTHRFRFDAKLNGLVTGALILLATTYLALSGASALISGATKGILATSAVATTATAGAATGLANVNDVQAYFANVSENDVQKFVADQLSGLNLTEQQSNAVVNAVRSEFTRVANYVKAAPLYDLPDTLNKGYVDLKNSLSGYLFRDKLTAEGLSVQQANDVSAKTTTYVNSLQQKVTEAVNIAIDNLAKTTTASTLTWLLTAALILGASVLGAKSMEHTTTTTELKKVTPNNSKKVRV